MDFKENIYSQNITVEFIEKLRDEIKFQSTNDLKNQIQLDVEKSREILNNSQD